jgi:hypothetical protein
MRAIFAKLFASQPDDDLAGLWMILVSVAILSLWFLSIALILPEWQ